MSTTDLGSIEAQLKEIRELLEKEHGPAAVTLKEAARLLSCSVRHVQRLVHRGELTTVMVGSLRRISRAEIRRITSPAMPELGQPRSNSRRAPTASMAESRPAGRPPKRGFSAAAFEAEFKASKLGKGKKKPKR